MTKIDLKAYDAQKRKELKDLEERWKVFLDRLEQRVKEVLDAAHSEGRQLFEADSEPGKRTYYRFKDALFGQIKGVNRKAEKIFHQYIEHQMETPDEYFDMDDTDLISDLGLEMTVSNNRNDDYYNAWEASLLDMQDKWEAEVEATDYEEQYNAVLEEVKSLNDKFACKQCGAPIPMKEVYFISTYIACPQCSTQNTFEPSTKVRQLQSLARQVAEQRCAALEKEYSAAVYDGDQTSQSKERAEALDKEREAYRKYQRAVHDEINKILPALKEETEKVFENMIASYAKTV